jgi:hypothetical protein
VDELQTHTLAFRSGGDALELVGLHLRSQA